MRALTFIAAVLLTLSALPAHAKGHAGKKHRSPPNYLKRVDPSQLPDRLPEGDLETFKTALQRDLAVCAQLPGDAHWHFEGRVVSRREWCTETAQAFLKAAQGAQDFASIFAWARSELDWYKSVGNDQGQVMYTGYYLPLLQASRVPTTQYRFPIYTQPNDLVQVTRHGVTRWMRKKANGKYTEYYDRKAIDVDGVLKGKGLELAYTDSLYDILILQVQGSGFLDIREADGRVNRVLVDYAAQNGLPYVSPRHILSDEGVPEEFLTIQGQRKYFALHPDQLVPVLIKDPSYVFFKVAQEGPFGSSGALLSPGHSIAIDERVFPMDAITLVSTSRPIPGKDGAVAGWQDFSRFAISQDTGGAIKTAGRVDFYWGTGAYAELAGGQMNQPGQLYFPLVRKH